MIAQALIIPDCHIPDEDTKAYKLMLDVASSLSNLQEIVILGDYADFFCISQHPKGSAKAFGYLKDEIHLLNARMDQLDREFPSVRKIYCEGNHEYRLSRYLSNSAPHLYTLVDFPSLTRLSSRDHWIFVPYGPYQRYNVLDSKLIARHTPLASGIHHAKNTATKGMASFVYGHVHQIMEAQVVGFDLKQYRAWCPGWLGDVTAESMQYVQAQAQWSLGFGVVSVTSDRNWFGHTCHIINYQTVHGDRIFRA